MAEFAPAAGKKSFQFVSGEMIREEMLIEQGLLRQVRAVRGLGKLRMLVDDHERQGLRRVVWFMFSVRSWPPDGGKGGRRGEAGSSSWALW